MRIPRYSLIKSESGKPCLNKDRVHHMRRIPMKGPADIAALANRIYNLSRRAEEHVVLICMDIRQRPIGAFDVSHGSCGAAVVSPREVFVRALLNGAVYIAVLHNHPYVPRISD